MPLLQDRFSRWALLSLAAGGLILGSVAHVQAADEGGLGGLLQQLFSPHPAPLSQPAPAPAVQSPVGGRAYRTYDSDRRHAWWPSARRRRLEEVHARVRPKVRYAALPKAEKVRSVVEKPKPAAAQSAVWSYARDPDGALMHDATLRRGDIVITTEGAKVFTGKAQEQHAGGEFEPVSRSKAVSRKTRVLLAAMVAPRGALPANEAAKAMAKLRASPSADTVAVQAHASALRVVYPGLRQQGSVKVSLQDQ
ncbi:hypothetical protein ACRBEV_04240 [Methylobacterium phyllosphaerae]